MTKGKWFLDFDYEANPKVPSAKVRDRLYEHLRTSKCTVTRAGKRIIFTDLDDAFRVRLDLDQHIISMGRATA